MGSPLPPLPETFRARLASARLLTPRVRELSFERVDGAPFAFSAGQWVSLVLPFADERGAPVRRAYSLASAAHSSPGFELAVTKVDGGAGSSFLFDLSPGATLEVKGPQGAFTRPLAAPRPALFVGTGTGVAPFRAMIQEAVHAHRSEPVWFLVGARTEEEVLYGEELAGLSAQHRWLRLIPSLSRPPPSWTGRTGYVQTHVEQLWSEFIALAPDAEAWVCGFKRMLETVRSILRVDLGLERRRVHLEAWD